MLAITFIVDPIWTWNKKACLWNSKQRLCLHNKCSVA